MSDLDATDRLLEQHRQDLQNCRKQYEGMIETLQAGLLEAQVENARLLQAVADGGLRAGELTGKVIDLERRLIACAKWVHGDQTQENYWRACGATNLNMPFKEEL